MPTPIVETNTFTSTVYVPNDLVEPANSASLKDNFVQGLTNRSLYLQQLLEVIGVRRFRCGTAAEMQYATGVSDKDVWLVRDGGGDALYNVFLYSSSSTLAADSPMVYEAPGMGSGRWLNIIRSLLNLNGGIPRLTSNGYVPFGIVEGAQQSCLHAEQSGSFSTSSTSYVQVTDLSVAIPSCQANDTLLIDWGGQHRSASTLAAISCEILDPSSTVVLSATVPGATLDPSESPPYCLARRFSVLYTGTHTVRTRIRAGTSDTAYHVLGYIRAVRVGGNPAWA